MKITDNESTLKITLMQKKSYVSNEHLEKKKKNVENKKKTES